MGGNFSLLGESSMDDKAVHWASSWLVAAWKFTATSSAGESEDGVDCGTTVNFFSFILW